MVCAWRLARGAGLASANRQVRQSGHRHGVVGETAPMPRRQVVAAHGRLRPAVIAKNGAVRGRRLQSRAGWAGAVQRREKTVPVLGCRRQAFAFRQHVLCALLGRGNQKFAQRNPGRPEHIGSF